MARFAVPLVLCALLAVGCGPLLHVRVAEIDLEAVDQPAQTHVYAADGSRIATLRLANREPAAREDLPDLLIDAVVAVEDRRFFQHDGVDLRAIARAALANQRAGHVVEGGSTITQQLVKNLYFPDAAETLERKAAEAHLARGMERERAKDDILVDYLNTVYFGAGAYGIIAAAQTYFDAEPRDLSLAQAALLAGLIRSPESASPHAHPEQALQRRHHVLEAMASTGAVARDAAEAADEAPLGVQPRPPAPPTRYPYFVAHVVRTLLAEPALGGDEATRVRRLYGGGLRIHTTIDPRLQEQAEAAARAFFDDPADPEVAIAVVRPSDGHIVAAVGGRDFAASQFDLATQARRQPGSAFKTFALVAALEQGRRLDDVFASGSVSLTFPDGLVWRVRSGTSGRMSLARATALSSNGAYARLAAELGPARIADRAAAMGITSEVGTNPAIVLGGLHEGVSPLEMAASYATIAAGGVRVPATPVARVANAEGEIVFESPQEAFVVMDGASAWFATQALRGVIEEGTGHVADIGRPAAGKTGTTQEHRDAWFVGYTPQLATAVWMGYPETARPLLDVHGVSRVEGGSWPARIWRTFMAAALDGEPALEFPYPAHLDRTVVVDRASGDLATEWCPEPEEIRGLPGELPTTYCRLHGPPPPETTTALPDSPPQDSGPADPEAPTGSQAADDG